MDFRQFIDEIKSMDNYRGQIVHLADIGAREAKYGELSQRTHPLIEEALKKQGIERLYTHQATAIEAIRAGKHVVIVTGTASGKTLCYQVPVLEALLDNPRSCAFLVFPTKALAQDQLRKLYGFGIFSKIRPATYDGDTPVQDRRAIRQEAKIVLTNPDMLHVGILPNHTGWSRFFRNLRYVVVDEVHTYRGVFGSHTGLVLRRLRRICRHYGVEPQFICCSATIANPEELMKKLVGLKDLEVVDNDGAPRGPKYFLFWNPPLLSEEGLQRRSTNSEATFLFTELVKRGISTITFTLARVTAELVLRYAQFALRDEEPELVDKIASYRAGYLPGERRAIEQGLFGGQLLGVTSTTALELGIDIGGLDASILTGYPGTIASTWQQAGRAGRGVERSLAVLVALDNPIDQYLMRHPDYFFGQSPEHAIVNPGNRYILAGHVLCAAHELPVVEGDEKYLGQSLLDILKVLEGSGFLLHDDKWRWRDTSSPAVRINIRSASGDDYQVLDVTNNNKLVGTVDSARAFWTIHEGAVYLHQGESYLVRELDIVSKVAYVTPASLDYFTQTRELTDIEVVETKGSKLVGNTDASFGDVTVTNQVIGYTRKQLFTEAVLAVENLDLPVQPFGTAGLWFEVPDEVVKGLEDMNLDLHGGIHALEHGIIGIMPLFAMCDRWDIGGVSHPNHPDTGKPTIFIYDAYPGGVGIAEKGFELLGQLLGSTLKAIEECPCEDGCPSCVQSPKCGNNNEPLDKQAAVFILKTITYNL